MSGLYLHIPFCSRRCVYCDFYSTTRTDLMPRYAGCLVREMGLRRGEVQGPLHTLYIGGGTPSLLPPALVGKLLDAAQACFGIRPDAEVTLEGNPDDLTLPLLRDLRGAGINRLSIGVQSFSNATLSFLRRRHTARQACEAVENARRAGFDNLSIDLIYGLPGESLEQWRANLDAALALEPEHISAYLLSYEEGTPLETLRRRGRVQEAGEDFALACYRLLAAALRSAGYEHYEISNFARKGCRSRHNSSYWKGIPYLGCGPSAHSYDGRNRQWNTPNLELYLREVGRCASPEDFMEAAWIEKEQLSTAERYNDLVVTALRTCEGIDLSSLRHSFGGSFAAYCLRNASPHLQKGSLEILPVSSAFSEGRLRLTRKGLFLSDGIMSDLLWVEETD